MIVRYISKYPSKDFGQYHPPHPRIVPYVIPSAFPKENKTGGGMGYLNCDILGEVEKI